MVIIAYLVIILIIVVTGAISYTRFGDIATGGMCRNFGGGVFITIIMLGGWG